MSNLNPIIAAYDVITPFGPGLMPLMDGLSQGKSTIKKVDRFKTGHFKTDNAAVIDFLTAEADKSFLLVMIEALLQQQGLVVPPETLILFASTVGEIDVLEQVVIHGAPFAEAGAGCLNKTLAHIEGLLGVTSSGMVVSAACASATAAIARACSMIKNRWHDSVLIVAGDIVSEFVFSGFSSLMALDDNQARPFDKDRGGLSAGEAAGYMLLMTPERAAREQVKPLGRVAGSGMSNDASHMTAPSREGVGLATAIRKALAAATIAPGDIAFIAAHGTGTHYNDAMEIKAFSSIFDRPIPAFSIKGATGHTMGSAGLIQCAVALEVLRGGERVPATVGLQIVDDDAQGWVSSETQDFDGKYGLVVNAGFGGINVAVVVEL